MGYGNETYTKRKSLKGKRKKKSPGLVVMGENYCSRGCVFESQLQILDGLFQIILLYTFFLAEPSQDVFLCCTLCIVYLNRPKISEKEAKDGPLSKRKIT